MKKLFALLLALLLALTGTAFAQTVVIHATVDRDYARELLPGFGVPEEQLGMVDPILAVVNALDVRVTTVADGAQVDLSLNDADALSLGWATDGAGASIVSTLFPNYILTIQNETIEQMMQQMSQSMPSGEGGLDMAALQEVFGGYVQKWMEACAAAGQPGEPVPGDYVVDGVAFDTLVPVTVDMPAIKAATENLLDELLADEAAMGMLEGMAQGMAQGGAPVDPSADFAASFKDGFEEWMAHFPETVTAEFYTNEGDETGAFYMTGESLMEGEDEPSFTYDMLYMDGQNMNMHCTIAGETPMDMGFAMAGTDMSVYFDMGGAYFGLDMRFAESDLAFDVFFMDPERPLLSVSIGIADGGDRTLPVEAGGKTALALEDFMANANSEAAQGLYADIQNNGMGALMGVAMQQVPELGALMGMAG